MKWRNQLLALFCLIGFGGLGVLYFKHWVIQKPFGIILFVGEGLTPARLAATRAYMGGSDAQLTMDTMPRSALLRNFSNDFAAPDQAAAASALATGAKVNNRALSVDPANKPLKTIVELAHEQGYATGLVTNARLTDPTSAAFYTHGNEPNDRLEIAREFVDGGKIDIAMGGGLSDFLPDGKGGERSDGRDLQLELRGKGYDIVRTRAELEGIPAYTRPKLFGAFANSEMAFVNELEARKEQPSLSDMVRRAVELLQFNPGGYLLVVDAALMGRAAQRNAVEPTLAETVELDHAIATARRYAGAHSAILVCGDVGIGGLSLNGFPFRKDSGIALLGLNSAGQPWMTWATGPHGAKSYGVPPQSKNENAPPEQQPEVSPEYLEPAAVYAKPATNTVEDVVAFGFGPGTEDLQGSLESTVIFELMRDQF